jgi:DNA-binding MarR family transcriptional regulator
MYMPSSELASSDFVGCLAGNLRAASRVASRVYDSALRESGIRITQVAILVQVRELQPVTVTALAAGLSGERSAVARDVAILERAGLVAGEVKSDDRRAREIRLTATGEQRLRESAPAWRAAQAAMCDAFGEERVRQLVELASQLVTSLDES